MISASHFASGKDPFDFCGSGVETLTGIKGDGTGNLDSAGLFVSLCFQYIKV